MTDRFGRVINSNKTSNNNTTSGFSTSYIEANYIESDLEEIINIENQ